MRQGYFELKKLILWSVLSSDSTSSQTRDWDEESYAIVLHMIYTHIGRSNIPLEMETIFFKINKTETNLFSSKFNGASGSWVRKDRDDPKLLSQQKELNNYLPEQSVDTISEV